LDILENRTREFYLRPKSLNIIISYYYTLVVFMVFNATFNNISAILWRSVLLMEEIGVLGKNHRPAERH